MDNVTDAVRTTMISAVMLTWRSSSPSPAMASVTWSTASDLVTICDAAAGDDAPDHRTALLTPSSIEYSPVEITNIPPEEILPILKQHVVWDKYETIEHLGIAENVRISDMMHKYGAWDYSPEQYQQLMSRINVGMIEEAPLIYNNYEVIWGWDLPKLDMHAYKWRDITNSLVKYANHKVVTNRYTADEYLKEYFENNPNSINIFWCSIGSHTKKKNLLKIC